MADEEIKKWLVKDINGHVRGPYPTDDILQRISRGEITGEEKVALYPGNNWISISKDPHFYDQLLTALYHESEKLDVETLSPPDDADDILPPKAHTRGPQPPPQKKNRAERIQKPQTTDGRVDAKVESTSPPPTEPAKKESASVFPDIELKHIKQVIREKKLRAFSVPVILAGAAVVLGAVFVFWGGSNPLGRTRLVAPRKDQPAQSEAYVKEKIQRGLKEYVKDTYSNYVVAQDSLVQAIEGDARNLGGMSLLCLTYLELWPYAYQDSIDLAAISAVTQMASRVDPAGVEAATCRNVDLIVRGRWNEAKGLTEMVLDTIGAGSQPPIAFYFFKSLVFYQYKEYESAVSYALSASQLWPQWLRVQSLAAQAYLGQKKYNEAANIYQNILKENPQHKVAKIQLGVIEYLYFRNYQKGEQLLASAMAQDERAPSDILSAGFLGLAEVALSQQDPKNALRYAQKAYAQNSSNIRAKEIIVQIGGEAELKEVRLLDTQLIYEGDQLVREGDCNSAQALYRTAYELNSKNGLAAMKAAECLWSLSLSTEATQYLDRAIRSDPNLIDAYVLLADYYSQRYNYQAAGQILAKAKTQAPMSYKVFRGFALVEFRRNNFPAAKNYAEKAIQLYESDVESYIILAQALLMLGDASAAFSASAKAVEIDLNNRQAQVVYGNTLASVRGMTVGLDYLQRMVNTYPTIVEYRLALGELYLKDQRYTVAQEIFQQVTKFADKPKKAHLLLGQSLQKQQQFEMARDAYFKAAALDPADVEPLFLAGLLYLETKQPSEARLQFQRVLRVNKDYPLVNYYIGRASLDMGSESEALEQANIEKLKNPTLAEPYILAAEVYTSMKQYSECAGEYQKALKYWVGGAILYVKLARCFRMAGNIDAALSMINQAGIAESGNPEVWKEQGAIYEMRQEKIKAIEAYNQYLLLAPNAVDRAQIEGRINILSR